jgi:hypothetical protein
MSSFDPSQPYRWLAFDINTQGQVVNWDPAAVVINTSQLANTFTGTFGLQRDMANPFQFYVTYSPELEPAAVLAACAAAAGVGFGWTARRSPRADRGEADRRVRTEGVHQPGPG